jgi:hypothetical protein
MEAKRYPGFETAESTARLHADVRRGVSGDMHILRHVHEMGPQFNEIVAGTSHGNHVERTVRGVSRSMG